MPFSAGGLTQTFSGTLSIVDYRGERATVTVPVLPSNFSDANANLTTIAEAVGDIINGDIIRLELKGTQQVAVSQAVTQDEAEGSVRSKAVFTFQDVNGRSYIVSLPTPDASIFLASNPQVVDINNADVQSFRDAVLDAIDDGIGPGSALVKGVFSSRSRQTANVPTVPPAPVEPASGANDEGPGIPGA